MCHYPIIRRVTHHVDVVACPAVKGLDVLSALYHQSD
jgi:hypothetical protein